MCGIVGFVGAKAVGPRDDVESILRVAADTLTHRGPDGSGYSVTTNPPAAFGHRRLAIIDLSDAAAQPMQSLDNKREIVFNGEIYNYKELRAELVAEGHAFSTASDTEVLLTACHRWGPPGAALKARGMFAFSYLDRDLQKLWLVRDRFGEKPMYWQLSGGTLSFASELKALRVLAATVPEIDRQSLAQYMRYQAISAPKTIFNGVHQVRAGTALCFSTSDYMTCDNVVESVYWDAQEEAERARAAPFTGSFSEATDTLEALLRRTVASAMVSDVPLGAFLSGGIDSSLIVSLMREVASGPVKTFTIGFEEDRFNEATHASSVAAHLGVDHTSLMVRASDALDVIPTLADMYDEPFGDSSQIPTHLVARLARRHVTVSLSGDGGDELFGGYNRYFLAGRLAERLLRVPRPLRRAAERTLHGISPAMWDRLGATARHTPLRRWVPTAVGDKAHKVASIIDSSDGPDLYERLLTHWAPDAVRNSAPPDIKSLRAGLSFTEQMMLQDTVRYLTDDILVKVDRAAMACSLETRVPMLDPDVFRFAWSLPLDFKTVGGTGKRVLRSVLDRHVPRALVDRPKMGFALPLDEWLRGPLRDWGEDLLSASKLDEQGYLDTATIRQHWTEHQSGRRNFQAKLWDVLMFQAWRQRWADT